MSKESLNQADMDLDTEPYETESNKSVSAIVPSVYTPPLQPHHTQIPIQALTDLQKQLLTNHLRNTQVQQQQQQQHQPSHLQFLHQHHFQHSTSLPQHFQTSHTNPSPNQVPNHEPKTTPSPQLGQFNQPSMEHQLIKTHQFQQQQQLLHHQHQAGIGQYMMHLPNLPQQHFALLQQQQQQRPLMLPHQPQQQHQQQRPLMLPHQPQQQQSITHEQIPLFQQLNQHHQQQQHQQRVNLQALQQQQQRQQHMVPIQTLAGQNHLIQQNPAVIQFLQQQFHHQIQHQQLQHQQQQQVAILGGLPVFNNHISVGKLASPPVGIPATTDQEGVPVVKKPVSLMDMSLPQPPTLAGQAPIAGGGGEFETQATANNLEAAKDYDDRYEDYHQGRNGFKSNERHEYKNEPSENTNGPEFERIGNGIQESFKSENNGGGGEVVVGFKVDLNENQTMNYSNNRGIN